jgi:transposase
MYTRLTSSKKSKNPTLQIVKGIRKGKKVKQKIVASLGAIKSKKDLISLKKLAENLIKKLEKKGLEVDQKINIKNLKHKTTIYDGFGLIVDRLMELSGFSKIIRKISGKQKYDLEEVIKLIIIQRLKCPSSKLRTYERQEDSGFCEIKLEHIYRAMDMILPASDKIQNQAFETISTYSKAHLNCFFFDVTTLHFESVIKDDIRDFGFSKDQKFNNVQIVLALVVDSEGNPIAYEAFKGNLAETKTLTPVLESLRKRVSIKNVTVVCDRGMASRANIEALQKTGFNFVIATKLRSISKKIKVNDLSLYKELPFQEHIAKECRTLYMTMKHPQYEDTLLISTYSSSRAKKDKEDRERFLEKLKKKLNNSNESSIKKIINNSGYKKYTSVKKGSSITINQSAIDKDASWDGFHGIAVSNSSKLTITDALYKYRDLWRVEEAFRIAKTTLKTRPIFHWMPHRIKSHILICFMTLFVLA